MVTSAIVTETSLLFPSFSSFFLLLSSLPSQERPSLEGASILFSSIPLKTQSPLPGKFQGEFQEWSHRGESLAVVFFSEAVPVR